MRRLSQKLRHYWHEIYYALVSERGIDFAMRCKDATEIVDLGKTPPDFVSRLRFYLHLSLCGACYFYAETTAALRKAMRSFVRTSEKSLSYDRLNQELITKWTKSS